MLCVALGVLGFLLALLFDHPRIERVRWAKLTIGVIAFSTLGYAVGAAAVHPSRFTLPAPIAVIGWVLAALFFLLFIYSVFIEVPFRQAYLGARNGELVDVGTYAMTRHPGVLWAALALVSLVMATASKVLLIATPLWVFMDMTWAYVEDRFYFPRTLEGYADYKMRVPMFIPTASSIREAARTILRLREKAKSEGTNGRHA